MAAARQTTLLIVGRVGNGKSSTGNTILGSSSSFDPTVGFTSEDTSCQVKESPDKTLKVICAPDVQHQQFTCRAQENKPDLEEETAIWLKAGGQPDAVLLVIRCDQRFREDEYDYYRQLKQSPSLKAVMEEKLIVVFTMGDHLYGRDIRLDLESHNPAFEDVQDIWKDAKKRYVVFDNTLRAGDARREAQVQNLLHIVRTKKPHPFPQHVCRLLVVGKSEYLCEIKGILPEQKKVIKESNATSFWTASIDRKTARPDKETDWFELEVVMQATEADVFKLHDATLVAISPFPHVIIDETDELLRHVRQAMPNCASSLSSITLTPQDLLGDQTSASLSTLRGKMWETAARADVQSHLSKEMPGIIKRIHEETVRRTEAKGSLKGYEAYISVKKEDMTQTSPRPNRCTLL